VSVAQQTVLYTYINLYHTRLQLTTFLKVILEALSQMAAPRIALEFLRSVVEFVVVIARVQINCTIVKYTRRRSSKTGQALQNAIPSIVFFGGEIVVKWSRCPGLRTSGWSRKARKVHDA